MSRRDEIMSTILDIESMPAASVEATKFLSDPEADMSDIVRAIEYDPGLTSNLLRMANSAYYGVSDSIGSVRNGIVRLGTYQIYQMIMSWGFSSLARQGVPGYGLTPGKLWEHSIGVAVGAEQISSVLSFKSADHAFTAGLLHDIGKIALGTFVEVDIDPILQIVNQEKTSFEAAERQVLGIDHAEAGAALLEHWDFPTNIVDTCRWHHQPDSLTDASPVLDLVHVADSMCMMGGIGVGIDEASYQTSSKVISRLNLDPLMSDKVVSEILSKLDTVCGLFAAGT